MKKQFGQNIDYWLHKTKAFLHDPPDKALRIQGHEERSNALLVAFGMAGSSLNDKAYHAADMIASSMDRATLPGYAKGDDSKNGAIDFSQFPSITHPTGDGKGLNIELNNSSKDSATVTAISEEIQKLIKKDMGAVAGNGEGLSEVAEYKGDENSFAPARFHYLFFLLRRRLAQENIGNLGGLWHRLPADTRLPDHSIWQHCGLVSALSSCHQLSTQHRASLMVYSLTPVQDFVERARKLRDYWSGSLLLSWLTFEGIKRVIYHLGADHLLYPSLHDQPLVDDLLLKLKMEQKWIGKNSDKDGVASFPNKFVCLVPTGQEEEIAEMIKQGINTAWQELGDKTLNLLEKKLGREDPYLKEQFTRQLGKYWEHHWATVPLVNEQNREELKELLHSETVESVFKFYEESTQLYGKISEDSNHKTKQWEAKGEGVLYSLSHRLVQAMLASGKSFRSDLREEEQGIKCDLFGEFEILHYQHEPGIDQNPKPSNDPFWKALRTAFSKEKEFGDNERLCALAVVKRLAHRVCIGEHPLKKLFKEANSFPSTTDMATHDWWGLVKQSAKDNEKLARELACFDWQKCPDSKIHRQLAQWFHELNEPEKSREMAPEERPEDNREQKKAARAIFKNIPVQDHHRYYAVLMMDGDEMGKLINGETLGATWGSVLHPELVRRLKGDFRPEFKSFWHDWLDEPRLISPAIHAAISESLANFSLGSVPAIIKKYGGRLIYAGGDDVCAILPASTVLNAAQEIAKAYRFSFVQQQNQEIEPLGENWNPDQKEKLNTYLGEGKNISISAGILITHHKKPLIKVMQRGYELLEMAKKEGGRNGFFLELDKRSGGGRIFRAKWDQSWERETVLEHFFKVADALYETEQTAMSSSLAYRLSSFDDGLRAIVMSHRKQMVPFIKQQLKRSGLNNDLSPNTREKELEEIAGHISALILSGESLKQMEEKLPLESLIIANFIGHCRAERRKKL